MEHLTPPDGYQLVRGLATPQDGDLVYGEFSLPGLPPAMGWGSLGHLGQLDLDELVIARRLDAEEDFFPRLFERA